MASIFLLSGSTHSFSGPVFVCCTRIHLFVQKNKIHSEIMPSICLELSEEQKPGAKKIKYKSLPQSCFNSFTFAKRFNKSSSASVVQTFQEMRGRKLRDQAYMIGLG